MAPLFIAAAVAGAVGTAISAIAQANALRGQARARQIEGEQELLSSKRQLRQELGQAAVNVGASGLLGGSFADVFESQAILDAEFLGQIKQRTDFDVASLKRAATTTLVTGLIGAGAQAAVGAAGAKAGQARIASAEAQRVSVLRANPNSRLRPGRNIFGSNSGSIARKSGLSTRDFQLRRARTATFN